jgi:hypothetical protein
MCLICLDLDRSVMSAREARRALGEMRAKIEPEHLVEVEKKIEAAEESAGEEP